MLFCVLKLLFLADNAFVQGKECAVLIFVALEATTTSGTEGNKYFLNK